MKIEKESKLGKIYIEIPINQDDIILHGSTQYRINRFVFVNESIYAVNTNSGLWENIEDLELIKENDNIKYFKVSPNNEST